MSLALRSNISIEKAVAAAKPFAQTTKFMGAVRPVLTTTKIDINHVLATNAHILIRIEHDGFVNAPYLHHYNDYSKDCIVTEYPDAGRIIPNPLYSKQDFTIDVNEFIKAHDQALIAAKLHKNRITYLKNDKVVVFGPISYTYGLGTDTNVNVAYNCSYMLIALKALKKLKVFEVTCHFYGPLKPLYLRDNKGLIDILVLPIKEKK